VPSGHHAPRTHTTILHADGGLIEKEMHLRRYEAFCLALGAAERVLEDYNPVP
jgi:hypothetical protein